MSPQDKKRSVSGLPYKEKEYQGSAFILFSNDAF